MSEAHAPIQRVGRHAARLRAAGAALATATPRPLLGRISEASGDVAVVEIHGVAIGDVVAFGPPWPTAADAGRLGEVVALRPQGVLAAPYGGAAGLAAGALARPAGAPPQGPSLDAALGRAHDALGRPIAADAPLRASSALARGALSETPFGRAVWRSTTAPAEDLGPFVRASDAAVALFIGRSPRARAAAARSSLGPGAARVAMICAGPERPAVERRRAVEIAMSWTRQASGRTIALVVDDLGELYAIERDASALAQVSSPGRLAAHVAANASSNVAVVLFVRPNDAEGLARAASIAEDAADQGETAIVRAP